GGSNRGRAREWIGSRRIREVLRQPAGQRRQPLRVDDSPEVQETIAGCVMKIDCDEGHEMNRGHPERSEGSTVLIRFLIRASRSFVAALLRMTTLASERQIVVFVVQRV